ncbi:MAG: cbb3-type cytochrome oxidase assembly protein CcoS [Pseudomonadales bacterium]|nr:cbb3-type cytochrome oxidase assembly protein CcoS [Pseudomonadales bacterium]
MEILYVLIPISLTIIAVAIWFFGWAIRSGQFDDLEGPAHQILFDDDEHMIPDSAKPAKPQQSAPNNDATNSGRSPDTSTPTDK